METASEPSFNSERDYAMARSIRPCSPGYHFVDTAASADQKTRLVALAAALMPDNNYQAAA
jgi:hypothetical protein